MDERKKETRKIPAYDWDWFESHTPFLKIIEKYSELKIDKELIPCQIFGYIWSKSVHYNIYINYCLFKKNFDEIKTNILNTRICKHNKEVRDWVYSLTNSRKDVQNLIIYGCLAFKSASFAWNFNE